MQYIGMLSLAAIFGSVAFSIVAEIPHDYLQAVGTAAAIAFTYFISSLFGARRGAKEGAEKGAKAITAPMREKVDAAQVTATATDARLGQAFQQIANLSFRLTEMSSKVETLEQERDTLKRLYEAAKSDAEQARAEAETAKAENARLLVLIDQNHKEIGDLRTLVAQLNLGGPVG
jgi:chromosome segregation ATPase